MIKDFKLFNLTLTNSKVIFDETSKNNTDNLLDLATRIKNALKIVHQYHVFRKKIVFVGNPLHINRQLSRVFKKTKHVFIPSYAWVAGHMTNKKSRTMTSKGRYGSTKLFSIYRLKQKSSLVVIIDKLRDSVAHSEFHSSKTPIISLNSGTKMLDETCVVKVPAKLVLLKSNLETFLFYSLLLKVLKRGKRKNQALPIQKLLYRIKKSAEKQKRVYNRRWLRKKRKFRKKYKPFYGDRKHYNRSDFHKTKQVTGTQPPTKEALTTTRPQKGYQKANTQPPTKEALTTTRPQKGYQKANTQPSTKEALNTSNKPGSREIHKIQNKGTKLAPYQKRNPKT